MPAKWSRRVFSFRFYEGKIRVPVTLTSCAFRKTYPGRNGPSALVHKPPTGAFTSRLLTGRSPFRSVDGVWTPLLAGQVERNQPDIGLGGQLIVRESEERPRALYIWVAAVAAGLGLAIGAIQASHYLSFRRSCRTIVATADTSQILPSASADIQSATTQRLGAS